MLTDDFYFKLYTHKKTLVDCKITNLKNKLANAISNDEEKLVRNKTIRLIELSTIYDELRWYSIYTYRDYLNNKILVFLQDNYSKYKNCKYYTPALLDELKKITNKDHWYYDKQRFIYRYNNNIVIDLYLLFDKKGKLRDDIINLDLYYNIYQDMPLKAYILRHNKSKFLEVVQKCNLSGY